jgi:tRNA A-37 threonylcarbamoyl transferase component Bud32
MQNSTLKMQNLLIELGLGDLYPRLEAKNVDLSVFRDICLIDGHLRMSSHTQRILMTDCGLKTKQLIAILKKYNELPRQDRIQ